MPKKEVVKKTKEVSKAPSKVSAKTVANKKVTFKKEDTEKNDNIFISNPVMKENYMYNELNLDEDELEKETEIENDDTELNDLEKDEIEKEKDESEDEDHELDDDTEYENDNINELDDLYDDMDNTKKSKKKTKRSEKEDDEDDELEKELCEYDYSEIYDEKKENPVVIVEDINRITFPRLTKYEKVRLIATRAKQLSLGAKAMIKNTTGIHPIEIAKLELEHRMIPMKIKRVLPDNTVEIWKLRDLDVDI